MISDKMYYIDIHRWFEISHECSMHLMISISTFICIMNERGDDLFDLTF